MASAPVDFVEVGLSVIGFFMVTLLGITAFFLMRLISQLDKTTNTVNQLVTSFALIAEAVKKLDSEEHREFLAGLKESSIALKADMQNVKKILKLD